MADRQTAMAVPHLPESRIALSFDAPVAVASADAALRLYGHGVLANPARRERLSREDGVEVFRLEMPASWPGRYRARKVIVERSGGPRGMPGDRRVDLELEDLTTGERVTLDAQHLTDMRTSAAGALGVRYLTASPPRTVALIGTGRVARAAARCLDADLGPQRILVTSRSRARRQAFRAAVAPAVAAEIVLYDGVAACLAEADAVVTAVPAAAPVLGPAGLPDHVPISVIAGDPRAVQLDVELLCRRPVVPDLQAQALRSGDLVVAERAGRLEEVRWARRPDGRVAHMGDAACARLHFRAGAAPIAYFTGLGVLDLHAGITVWEAQGHAPPPGP